MAATIQTLFEGRDNLKKCKEELEALEKEFNKLKKQVEEFPLKIQTLEKTVKDQAEKNS